MNPVLFKLKKLGIRLGIVGAIIAFICAINLISDYSTRLSLQIKSEESDDMVKLIGKAYVEDAHRHPVAFIVAGKPFFVHNFYTRNAECYYDISINVTSPTTDYLATVKNVEAWGAAGELHFNEYLTMPPGFPAGEYRLVKKIANHCDNRTYFSTVFDIPITVVDDSGS